ncbi:DUF4971 domain-containing protein [Bacteroides sp.]|uniref:DUF4971 domain-containing protein n=1 Tax=Bacteroides sp. TaxID=29523 RepID=UPI00261A2C03|nr:DUF4971 domain-containing protein [Bacteroides sp.]MDD3036916.1 DUF4971 domain-containing protein [Bacteroides sp.]
MMKRKILLLLSMTLMGISSIACSDDETNDITSQKRYPLTTFAVAVKGAQADNISYYHGKIDQTTHKVEIGVIENANVISGVEYTLMNDGATISPDPATFVGKWNKEQTVTVTTEDHKTTTYTIILTKFKEQDSDVLFFDDFNVNGHPDQTKWVLCQKSGSDWNDEMSESYDQAYVEDGKLILKAEKVGGEYKAGGIETQGKFDFAFGKVEVKARLTSYPNGAFPAIWMMPKTPVYGGWPQSGEIDIMEHIKQESVIHHTIHTHYTYDLNLKDPINTAQVPCDFKDWTIYTVEKTQNKLTFYVNGEETFSYSNQNLENEAEMKQWPFTENNPFYLILNMGLGGDREGSWAGPIDDNNLPAIMEIDYVKVSKLDK